MKNTNVSPLIAALFMLACTSSLAFHQPPNVKTALSKTAIPTASSDSQTVLNYRDQIEDEAGLLNGFNAETRKKLLSTGVKLDVVSNLATSQAGALVAVSGLAAISLAASGHPVDLNCIHWNGAAASFQPLFNIGHLDSWKITEGVLAATPMIYLSNHLEKSDKRDMSHVNFSTMSKSIVDVNTGMR